MSVHSQFSGNPSPLRALAARIESDDFDAHANAASGAPASRKEEARSMVGFADLGLVPQLVSAVSKAGFRSPTEVQARCIPEALAGYDLMVSAQTGSGKTAAFMLAALHRLVQAGSEQGVAVIADEPSQRRESGRVRPERNNAHRGGTQGAVQILVLTPTRELAIQVCDAARMFARDMRGLNIVSVVGGMPYGAQLRALSKPVDVLVATPGRLLDHVQAGRVNLSKVQTLVLDEADRMLDMGFIEDIEAIVGRTPATRQTLLFSATLDGTVARLAARMMREPRRIALASQQDRHANITQSLYIADDHGHKTRLLEHLLREADVKQAIVFTGTKRAADELAARLNENGFAAAALHGGMNQRQRNRTLTRLQRGQVRMLVATDVAARGIDVQGISHVVNFDLPMQAEDYVHRIGRTGRAGRSGLAFTLVTHAERHKVRCIEQYTGQRIPTQTVAGLEPKKSVDTRAAGAKKSSGWSVRPKSAGAWREDRPQKRTWTGSDSEGRRRGDHPSAPRDRFASPRPARAGANGRGSFRANGTPRSPARG